MAFAGRYSLVVEENEKRRSIPLDIFNAKNEKIGKGFKADLASVDLYTTKFSSPQEMIEDLRSKNITVNGYRTSYINYRYDKKLQKLQVAFSDHQQLREIAKRSDYKINTNGTQYNKFLMEFLRTLDNNSFYLYLKNKKENDMYILDNKSKLKEYIDERVKNGKYDDFVLSKIKEHMSSYKKFRDMYMALYEYNLKLEEITLLLNDGEYYSNVINLKTIRAELKECFEEYVFTSSDFSKHKIKEKLSYSELLVLDKLKNDYMLEQDKIKETRQKELQELEELRKELLVQKELQEKYPEAYVEHKMNPYSSYEEEVEYQEYLDHLDNEYKEKVEREQPKIKLLKKSKKKNDDFRQLTIFDIKK
ncbi:MAG: hypothetical protein PHD10_02610 [Bacilli bacterium]|nr:hypothetical protein [Bacilli bacterium]MDD4608003.1 hypothetical protein [Bacilli bacterium]